MNPLQYNGTGYPLGATASGSFWSNVYSAPDGSKWLSGVQGIPYDSSYGNIPESVTTTFDLLNGPVNGFFTRLNTTVQFCLAYNPSNSTYCTGVIEGRSGVGFYYYTSTDNGATWTKRTFPNNTIQYTRLKCVSGIFVAVANSTTTNGIITSTDGITWTSVNAPSTGMSSAVDIVSNGSSNILIIGTGVCFYSTNSGASFALATGTPILSFSSWGYEVGTLTWNQGASLWIFITSTAGSYATSPDGSVWTTRSTSSGFAEFSLFQTSGLVKFASNATKTIAFMNNGFIVETTDGLTWTNPRFIANNISTTTSAANIAVAFYDGTRFVVNYNYRLFYSSDGTSWTEAPKMSTFSTSSVALNSVVNNKIYSVIYAPNGIRNQVFLCNDITSTTPKNIASAISSSLTYPQSTATRIK